MIRVMKVITTVIVFIGLLGACSLDTEGTFIPAIMSAIGIIGSALLYFLYWRNIYDA